MLPKSEKDLSKTTDNISKKNENLKVGQTLTEAFQRCRSKSTIVANDVQVSQWEKLLTG